LRTILLVDDSITIQKVVEQTFVETDFKVTSLGNGDEALEKLSSWAPDLIIADVHMPGASGYEIASRARQMGDGIPVLLLVGTFEPFDEGEAEASGASGFLMKPFDSQELLSRVEELSQSDGEVASAVPGSEPEPAAAPSERSEAARPSQPALQSSPDVEDADESAAAPTLSNADVERIARRLVELISPEITRQISQEVIPELVERVVRERIRQLEQED